MEDDLVRLMIRLSAKAKRVLILVVVEDDLVQVSLSLLGLEKMVLILVVVEDDLVLDLIRHY